MRKKNEAGWTAIEAIIVCGVFACLAIGGFGIYVLIHFLLKIW